MNRVKATFLIRKNKIKSNGKAPIYLRVTVDEKRKEISTKKEVAPEKWCVNRQRVKGNGREVQVINNYLDQIQREVLEAETQILKEGEEVTAEGIKTKMIGEEEPKVYLIDFFEDYLRKMKELIGNGFAENTYKRYRTCLKHLKAFVQQEFSSENIALDELDLAFVRNFQHFLKTKDKPCSHNSALKYIDHFRKVINVALDHELTSSNPFKRFNSKYETTDPEYLNGEELRAIEKKSMPVDRVGRVKDVFLFCCYTGLAFTDVEKLTKEDVEVDKNGDQWLVVARQKTKEPSIIMLLPVPLSIIEKYKDDPETSSGNLLPVISNQKTNAYLKEIAQLCGINKNITFHMARHTFGTTVSLENDVPMDTVQKIMGHKDIRSTMLYARVTRRKVGKDLERLRENLSEK